MTGSSLSSNLATTLNIATTVTGPSGPDLANSKLTPSEIMAPINVTADMDLDYKVVRRNLKNLMDTADQAILGILSVASEGDNPRAYEVVSTLIQTALDANSKLIDLHQQMKDLKDIKGIPTMGLDGKKVENTVTNTTVYVGTTSEMLKLIKKHTPNTVNAPEIVAESVALEKKTAAKKI